MRHAIVAAAILLGLSAGLAAAARAQEAPPTEVPETGAIQPGDDAMTDVDPEVVAQCSAQATTRRLQGAARKAFMEDCVALED